MIRAESRINGSRFAVSVLRYEQSPGRRIWAVAGVEQKGSIMMGKAVVSYHGAEVCAWEQDGCWTVQLDTYEASSSYLDLALAELAVDGADVHELAARLISEVMRTRSVGAAEAVAA